MNRRQRGTNVTPLANLPLFVEQAAARLGMDAAQLRGWAQRPDGSVMLLCANGMKFVVTPE